MILKEPRQSQNQGRNATIRSDGEKSRDEREDLQEVRQKR